MSTNYRPCRKPTPKELLNTPGRIRDLLEFFNPEFVRCHLEKAIPHLVDRDILHVSKEEKKRISKEHFAQQNKIVKQRQLASANWKTQSANQSQRSETTGGTSVSEKNSNTEENGEADDEGGGTEEEMDSPGDSMELLVDVKATCTSEEEGTTEEYKQPMEELPIVEASGQSKAYKEPKRPDNLDVLDSLVAPFTEEQPWSPAEFNQIPAVNGFDDAQLSQFQIDPRHQEGQSLLQDLIDGY